APASLTISPNEASGESGGLIGEFTVSTTASSVPLTLNGPEGVQTVDLEGNPVTEVGNEDKFSVLVPEGTADGEATVSASVSATVEIGRLFKGLQGDPPTQTLITADKAETTASAEVKVTWTAPAPSDDETPGDDEPPGDDETPTPGDDETPPATESPKPTPPADDKPGLPVTGAALGGLIAAAVVAVGGGGAAMYLARKRKSNADDA